ncbi:MAG: deoxyribose-phosphate aldolase [Clostridia bacterium]|nr:deoxyribose-phosphate aldolase [Clostridia bacterium]
MKYLTLKEYAAYIDHSTLLPTDTRKTVEENCDESIRNGYACFCVTPATLGWAVDYAREKKAKINISAAVAFPHGTSMAAVKAFEASESCREGANEIDMVMNINLAKQGEWKAVRDEIQLVRLAMSDTCPGSILKVIVETCLLTAGEKERACTACIDAGADYIKTSTGFSTGGAAVEDIGLFKRISEGRIKIKASGGIKTAEGFLAMIEAGASRIGTKFSGRILAELTEKYRII